MYTLIKCPHIVRIVPLPKILYMRLSANVRPASQTVSQHWHDIVSQILKIDYKKNKKKIEVEGRGGRGGFRDIPIRSNHLDTPGSLLYHCTVTKDGRPRSDYILACRIRQLSTIPIREGGGGLWFFCWELIRISRGLRGRWTHRQPIYCLEMDEEPLKQGNHSAGLVLDQRRRRWSNTKPALEQHQVMNVLSAGPRTHRAWCMWWIILYLRVNE